VNHRPPVGLCLDSNEDRVATEQLVNLDQMGIWFRNLEINVTAFISRANRTLKRIHHLHFFELDVIEH